MQNVDTWYIVYKNVLFLYPFTNCKTFCFLLKRLINGKDSSIPLPKYSVYLLRYSSSCPNTVNRNPSGSLTASNLSVCFLLCLLYAMCSTASCPGRKFALTILSMKPMTLPRADHGCLMVEAYFFTLERICRMKFPRNSDFSLAIVKRSKASVNIFEVFDAWWMKMLYIRSHGSSREIKQYNTDGK